MSSGSTPASTSPATLAALIWPAGPDSRLRWARAAVLALLGTGLLTLSAKVQVPFPPVPMTLQTLVVLVLGAAYGARLGGATVALYLAEGFLGLPVFAGAAAGPLYVAGPTGGFLAGFLVAAVAVGWLAERGFDRSLPRLLVLMTLGHLLMFAGGLLWLAVLVGPAKAWAVGAAPFWLATLLKTGLAAVLMHAARTAMRR